MARRGGTVTHHCAEPACRETRWFGYDSQRERAEIEQDQARKPFRCIRHADPDEVLRPDNPRLSHVLVATRLQSSYDGDWLPGLYWVREGGVLTGSGFTSGPGFSAFASDFPEGTRLTVTSCIEIQDDGGEG